jgi:hypothetical protein
LAWAESDDRVRFVLPIYENNVALHCSVQKRAANCSGATSTGSLSSAIALLLLI